MKIEKLKFLVVDDEPQILETLVTVLNNSVECEVIGTADSVSSAFDAIVSLQPDVLFLDIKLKGGDAFQLLNLLKRNIDVVPPVILNTGFNEFEYAQRSLNEFKDIVLMILKKPFWGNWAEKEDEMIRKIRTHIQSLQTHKKEKASIKIKSNYTTHIIQLEDLILIESDPTAKGKGKLYLKTRQKEFSIYMSLGNFLEKLSDDFIRVSRYSIINKKFISSYEHNRQLITIDWDEVQEVSVGRSYKEGVMEVLG